MVPDPDPALELAAWLAQPDPDELPLDLRPLYPAEMAVPEVAKIMELYAGLDTHGLHRAGRPVATDDRFCYGDTPAPVLYRLLRRWGVGPQDVFYDLGCGCGMAMFTAALLAGRVYGVDLVPPAIEFCRRSAQVMGVTNAEFEVRDLLETDLAPATFIYLASTAFPAALRRPLGKHLLSSRRGTRILSVTHPFKARGIREVKRVRMPFSWSGRAQAYPFEFIYHVRE